MHGVREWQSLRIHREVAARLRADPDAVVGKALGNLARWSENRGDDPVLQEWRDLLRTRSAEDLAAFIESEAEAAVRLRQSSPFAGVLSAREVWEIKRCHAPTRT